MIRDNLFENLIFAVRTRNMSRLSRTILSLPLEERAYEIARELAPFGPPGTGQKS